MNKINEKHFLDRYGSLLFKDADEQKSFSLECGDGWLSLIDGSLQVVGRYAEDQGLEVSIDAIKEKFGLLRAYHRGGDETIDRIFDIAEMVSSCTCEICGEVGRLREANGWLQVRCIRHQLPGSSESAGCNLDEAYATGYATAVSLVLWFFGGKYVTWLDQECIALGGVRPVEALATVEGCGQISILLRQLEHGVVP